MTHPPPEPTRPLPAAEGRTRLRAVLAVAGAVAFVVLVGAVVWLNTSTTGGPTTGATVAAGSTPEAAGSAAPARGPTAGRTRDPKGVVTACGVVLPALEHVRTGTPGTSPDRYGELLTHLANTIVTGASATTDSTFLDHVGQLSHAFQQAWQDSSYGTAPSAVAHELMAAGAPVRRDCTAAGYHP